MTMLENALDYIKQGFRVFPVKPDKTPLTPHGLKDATQTQQGVKEYWTKWPDAGIGLVTDGLIVLDFDYKANGLVSREEIEKKYGLPQTRIHLTGGGGFHYLYKNPTGTKIKNTVTLGGYPGVDLRADGGYIVAPPSRHSNGNDYQVYDYSPIVPAPDWLMAIVSTSTPLSIKNKTDPIPEGQRNNTLTKIAGKMRNDGLSEEVILAALTVINNTQCQPSLPESEVLTISKSVSRYQPMYPIGSNVLTYTGEGVIGGEGSVEGPENPVTASGSEAKNPVTALRSVTDRYFPLLSVTNVTGVTNVTQDIVREYISESTGQWIDYKDLDNDLGIKTPEQKAHRRAIIFRLIAEEFIEKHPSISTRFRLPDRNPQDMVLNFDAQADYLPLKFPFGIEDKVDVYHKSLTVVAGTKEAGKTAFLLNTARKNCDLGKVHYFNSEMGDVELMNRLRNFDDYRDWVNKIHWIERSHAFEDIIFPDDINIIDFLEITQEFYLIGGFLSAIYRKLNNGIAIIAIQKDPRKQYGRGDTFGMEKARLYITLNHKEGVNIATIEAGKMWHDEFDNPRGQFKTYKIVKGCYFTNESNWQKPDYKGGF